MASKIERFDIDQLPSSTGAVNAKNYIKRLRESLDRGEIEVSEFLKKGKEAAQYAYDTYLNMAPAGASSAAMVNFIVDEMKAGNGWSGFKLDKNNNIKPLALGQEYEERLRQELIPSNIQGEEREALLKEIPTDIGFDTDRFAVEREAIRQKTQQKTVLEQQKGIQKDRLGELATLLAAQEKRQFEDAIPEIASTAQAQGFLETSGFGNALAREKARLAANTQTALGLQALDDRDFEVQAVGDIVKNLNQMQTAGLQRKFGLDDREYSENLARELARLSKPDIKQPSSLERALPFLQLGTSAAMTGASKGVSR